MSAAAEFLAALGRAIYVLNAFDEGHAARIRAIDLAFERARLLQVEEPTPEFTFLGQKVYFGRRPLPDMADWDWTSRLSSAGVQRLELLGPLSRDELEGFLREVLGRLLRIGHGPADAQPSRMDTLRYGAVDLGGGGDWEPEEEEEPAGPQAFTLREEAEAVHWIHEELRAGRGLGIVEAETVAFSLSGAMLGYPGTFIPQIRKKRSHRYGIPHAMNVCALSMALARTIGLEEAIVRPLGVAALLHDVGKTKVPEEVLYKDGRLTDEERRILNTHPEEGARILLMDGGGLELAAVVAYEHHIGKNGRGYPTFTHGRSCHPASDLVHVCNVFDALRSLRPHREAWSAQKALSLIQYGAGEEFDSGLVGAFVSMLEASDTRIVEVGDETHAFHLSAEETEPGSTHPGGPMEGTGAEEGE